jgi:ribosomal protein S18 acetylase RimI-like enzyme
MKKFFKKPIPDYKGMLSKGGPETGFLGSSFHQFTSDIWESCAKLYCQIWREPPWNEDFWEEDRVLGDIKRELERPGAEAFLAVQNRLAIPINNGLDVFSIQVVGFTWGYLVRKKDAREISRGFSLDYLFDKEEFIFYIDELAVASFARNRKIGETLNGLLVQEAKGKGVSGIFLRTDKRAVAARNLYSKMGFKDLEEEDSKHPDRTFWLLEL